MDPALNLLDWPLLGAQEAALVSGPELMSMFGVGEEDLVAKANFMPMIQKFAKVPLKPEDVHVRGMRVTNSRVNSWYGRLSPGALAEVAALIPGRPLMAEHNTYELPRGTFFAAQRVFSQPDGKTPRKDSYAVVALFYFPRDPEGDAMARRIDAGIYREASLGWSCQAAECSVCGEDVRSWGCGHMPGEVYEETGLASFEMSGVTFVHEVSIVYAGAVRETEMFLPEGASDPDAAALRCRDEARRWGAVKLASALALKRSERGALGRLVASRAAGVTLAPGAIEADDLARLTAFEAAEPMRTSIQSVICSKERFDSAAEAAAWCREHEFRADKVDETGTSYRFRQFDPGKCVDDSFRTMPITDGVDAAICKKKSAKDAGRSAATSDPCCGSAIGSYEDWFSTRTTGK